jgi:ABC-type uncharacterized transport system substrate-binding protein
MNNRMTGFFALFGLLMMSLGAQAVSPYAGKKILFIDSYHEGYVWSDGITEGVKRVLLSQAVLYTPKDQRDKPSGIKLKILRMDTKRKSAEESKQLAAVRAKAEIESFKPDVVIACDDNAAKYLIEPFYKDADLPFVFCGVNWDASVYGFPYKNVTGMIEVDLADEVIAHLKPHAKGERIGIIGADNETTQKVVENYRRVFGIVPAQTYLSTSFAAWKNNFIRAQEEVDMLFLLSHAGINDWDDAQAKAFVEATIKIPTGTAHEQEPAYAVISFTKVAQEQGVWAAQTALRILDGVSPADIPIAANAQSHLILNLRLAEKLDITFEPDLLNLAEIIR